MVKELKELTGRVDVLVNNAGLAAGFSYIHEGSLEDWEQMKDVQTTYTVDPPRWR